MESTKFLKLVVLERRKPVDRMLRQGEDRNGMNWGTYEKLAALTKYIDYDCRFTSLGCKQYRFKSKKEKDKRNEAYKKNNGGRPIPSLMCCCGGCRHSIGHARSFNIDSIAKVARYYNDKTGFWREGKGCILPRKYRSYTCLNHSCGGKNGVGMHLLEVMKMSEAQLYRYFEKNYPKHKCRNYYSWTIAGIIKFFKFEFENERRNRRAE